jgi:predicted GNAT family acetyltransferase
MEIKHRLIGSKGMFYYEQEGKPLDDMTYSMAGDALIIIDHNEVDASLRGQNVGKQLLHFAVDYVLVKRESKSYRSVPLLNQYLTKHQRMGMCCRLRDQ